MRSRLTSRRSRSATASTACTHISASSRLCRPTLQLGCGVGRIWIGRVPHASAFIQTSKYRKAYTPMPASTHSRKHHCTAAVSHILEDRVVMHVFTRLSCCSTLNSYVVAISSSRCTRISAYTKWSAYAATCEIHRWWQSRPAAEMRRRFDKQAAGSAYATRR